MNPHVRAWLLEGTEPPPEVDLSVELATDPEAARLSSELEAIDLAAAALPHLPPPPERVEHVLRMVEGQASMPPAIVPAPPSPRGIPQRWFIAGLVGLSAAAVALFVATSPTVTMGPIGDSSNFVYRGHEGPLTGIGLRMVVDHGEGIHRFERGQRYRAGQALLFRYDAEPGAWLQLVRVDDAGATLLHTQRAAGASGDLETQGLPFGYVLESGERAAVYALLRVESPEEAASIAEALAVRAEPGHVCAAAFELNARCVAEHVEAVP